jgi:hypothetical protein
MSLHQRPLAPRALTAPPPWRARLRGGSVAVAGGVQRVEDVAVPALLGAGRALLRAVDRAEQLLVPALIALARAVVAAQPGTPRRRRRQGARGEGSLVQAHERSPPGNHADPPLAKPFPQVS